MDMAKIRNSSVENMLAHFQVDTAWVINTGERKGGGFGREFPFTRLETSQILLSHFLTCLSPEHLTKLHEVLVLG